MEEQSAATNEISRNVNEACQGAEQITEAIAGVAEGARITSTGAEEALTASTELSRISETTQEQVQAFKVA